MLWFIVDRTDSLMAALFDYCAQTSLACLVFQSFRVVPALLRCCCLQSIGLVLGFLQSLLIPGGGHKVNANSACCYIIRAHAVIALNWCSHTPAYCDTACGYRRSLPRNQHLHLVDWCACRALGPKLFTTCTCLHSQRASSPWQRLSSTNHAPFSPQIHHHQS